MVFPPEAQIEMLAEQFLNGNQSYTADEISDMTPAAAAYVTGMICAAWVEQGRQDEAATLLRYLARRIED